MTLLNYEFSILNYFLSYFIPRVHLVPFYLSPFPSPKIPIAPHAYTVLTAVIDKE